MNVDPVLRHAVEQCGLLTCYVTSSYSLFVAVLLATLLGFLQSAPGFAQAGQIPE